jgi:hypothetical protein
MEPLPPETESSAISPSTRQLLAGSCTPLLVVYVLLGAMAGLSLILFLSQLFYQNPDGTYFRDEPRAPWHLFGHLLRGFTWGFLSLALWKYRRTIQALSSGASSDLRPFAADHRVIWYLAAISLGALLAYALLTVASRGW